MRNSRSMCNAPSVPYAKWCQKRVPIPVFHFYCEQEDLKPCQKCVGRSLTAGLAEEEQQQKAPETIFFIAHTFAIAEKRLYRGHSYTRT
eukprot:1160039-Pelagomonas_calceolata.AAC.1